MTERKRDTRSLALEASRAATERLRELHREEWEQLHENERLLRGLPLKPEAMMARITQLEARIAELEEAASVATAVTLEEAQDDPAA